MSFDYPITASSRRKDYVAAGGQTVFGPVSDYLVFDANDIRVRTKGATGPWQTVTTGYTAALSALPGYVTVTFAVAPAAGTQVRIEGLRIPRRESDVTRAGALQSAALERDLDRMTVTVQETRRDIEDLAPEVDIIKQAAIDADLARDEAVAAAAAASADADLVGSAVRVRHEAGTVNLNLFTVVDRFSATDPLNAPITGGARTWIVEVLDTPADADGVVQRASLVNGDTDLAVYQRRRRFDGVWSAWAGQAGAAGRAVLAAQTQEEAQTAIGFAESARDVIAAMLVAGSNVTITNNDPGDQLTIASVGTVGAPGIASVLDESTDGWKWVKWNVDAPSAGSFDSAGVFTATPGTGRYRPVTPIAEMKPGGVAVGERIMIRFRVITQTGTFGAFNWSTDTQSGGVFQTEGQWRTAVITRAAGDNTLTIDLALNAGATLQVTHAQYAFITGDGLRPSVSLAPEQARVADEWANLWPPSYTVTNGSNTAGAWTLNVAISTAAITAATLQSGQTYTLELVPENPLQPFACGPGTASGIEFRNGSESVTFRLQNLPGGRIGGTFTPVLPTALTIPQVTLTGDNRTVSPAVFTAAPKVFKEIRLLAGALYPAKAAAAASGQGFDPGQIVVEQSANTIKVHMRANDGAGTLYVTRAVQRQIDAALRLDTFDVHTVSATRRTGVTAFSDLYRVIQPGGKNLIVQESAPHNHEFMGPQPHGDDTMAEGFQMLFIDGARRSIDGATTWLGRRCQLIYKHHLFRTGPLGNKHNQGTTKVFEVVTTLTFDGHDLSMTTDHRLVPLITTTLDNCYVGAANINHFQNENAGQPRLITTAWVSAPQILDPVDVTTIDLVAAHGNVGYPGAQRIGVAGANLTYELEPTKGWTSSTRELRVTDTGSGGARSSKVYPDFFPAQTLTAGAVFDIGVRQRILITE